MHRKRDFLVYFFLVASEFFAYYNFEGIFWFGLFCFVCFAFFFGIACLESLSLSKYSIF